MTTTNHYDLIVLGSHLAGLVAATLVAARQRRVLVLPLGPVDGTYRLGRQSLPLETAPLVHLRCPAPQAVFDELSLLPQLRRILDEPSGVLAYALGDARLDVEFDGGTPVSPATQDSLDSHYGPARADHFRVAFEQAERTTRYFDEVLALPAALRTEGFWQRRFVGRFGPELTQLAGTPTPAALPGHDDALAPWLTDLTHPSLSIPALMRLSTLACENWGTRGTGPQALRNLLLERLSQRSGEVKPGLRVQEILFRRARVTGVELLGRGQRYGCDHLLVATDPARLIEGSLISVNPGDLLTKTFSSALKSVHRRHTRFVLHAEVAQAGLSPALGNTVVVRGAGGQLRDTTYVRQHPSPREEHRRLSITRIVDPTAPLAQLRESTLAMLRDRGILPFVERHLAWVHSPHDGRPVTDAEGAPIDDEDGFGSDTELSLPMHPLVDCDLQPTLGVGLLPLRSGIKNLTFASRLSLPGLGVEGEFAAGIGAAHLIAPDARASKSGVFRR